MRDEACCKVIEQLRISRLIALRAKIAGCRYQGPAEMPVPHAIHDHARREGRGIAENLLCQLQAARSLFQSAVSRG